MEEAEQSESIKRGYKTQEGDREDFLEEGMSKQTHERRIGVYQLNRRGKKMQGKEFPGSPGVRTLRFHCRRPGDQSLVRELRSHKPRGVARKRKRKKERQITKQKEEHEAKPRGKREQESECSE